MNPITNSQIPAFFETTPLFFVEDGVLRASRPLEEIDPKEFWSEISRRDMALCLGPDKILSKEELALYASLNLEIPPGELITLKEKISLEKLQKLTQMHLPPLHAAAYLGSIPLMKKALENGCCVNEKCPEEVKIFGEHPALTVLAVYGHDEAFEWLLGQGASLDSLKRLDLLALLKAYPKLTPILVRSKYLEIQLSGFMSDSIFHQAAESGDVELIELLVDSGAPVNLETQYGSTPLKQAIHEKQLKAVTTLIKLGANFENHLEELILTFGPEEEILSLLRGKKLTSGDVLFRTMSSLKNKQSDLVTLLIKNKIIDPNVTDKEGIPFFHLMLKRNETSIVRVMLESGVDKNIPDKNGVTPLHLAVCIGQRELIEMLLEFGCDPNVKTPSEITPLHIAADRSLSEIMQILIKAGADVNARSFSGKSAGGLLCRSPYQWTLFQSLLDLEKNISISPYRAYDHHKIQRVNILQEFAGQISEADKLGWKENSRKKLCAHACEVGGLSLIALRSDTNEKSKGLLDGMSGDKIFMRKGGKYLERLSKSYPKLVPAEKVSRITDACTFVEESAMVSDEAFLERILSGEPTILSSGFYHHAADWVFWGDLVAACNRGPGSQRGRPVEVYRFDPSTLTAEIIGEIRNSPAEKSYDYEAMLVSTLKTLKAKQGPFEKKLEEVCPLKEQKMGNCTYASFEAALWTLLAVQETKEHQTTESLEELLASPNRLFDTWRLFTQLTFLDNYLTSHLEDKTPYYPDVGLCQKALANIEEQKAFENSPLLPMYQVVKDKTEKLRSRFEPLELPQENSEDPVKVYLANTENGKTPTFSTLREEYYSSKKMRLNSASLFFI